MKYARAIWDDLRDKRQTPLTPRVRCVRGSSCGGVGVYLLFRVIAAADEGAAFDVAEAALFAAPLPFGELVGVDPAVDGEVLGGGLEVLAEGEDVDADGDEVVEDGVDFFGG